MGFNTKMLKFPFVFDISNLNNGKDYYIFSQFSRKSSHS